MTRAIIIACLCGPGLLACSSKKDDEGDLKGAERLLDALQRGMHFDNGAPRDGNIPKADPEASDVAVAAVTSPLMLSPGKASIMPLDVGNSDESNRVRATLLQFQDADDHVAVPADPADAGMGTVTLDNPFTIADDICERLCKRTYTTRIEFAVELDDGSVSAHGQLELVLDCNKSGDPDLCDANDTKNKPDTGVGKPNGSDASTLDAGTTPNDSGADPGANDAAINDASFPRNDAGPPPQLLAITPGNAEAGVEAMITIQGIGFDAGATALVNGAPVPTTFVDDTTLEVRVLAAYTANPGSLAIEVENVFDDVSSRSNVLYLVINPVPGAPVIYDYTPDNGVAGDTIRILATNLAGQTLTITDAAGTPLTPGALGTLGWPTVGTVDTVEVVLPDDVVTGPITVSNDLGSYRGKVFSVGLNLTRATGTVIEASSEFNTTNWSKASGADNDLATSYFTANGDCATSTSCTMVPWYQVTFASKQTVARIAMRGNREYASGYDFIRGTFEVLNASDGVLWSRTYDLPEPDRDLDIVLSPPISGARAVRFTSLEDESGEPGFAEFEVFGP